MGPTLYLEMMLGMLYLSRMDTSDSAILIPNIGNPILSFTASFCFEGCDIVEAVQPLTLNVNNEENGHQLSQLTITNKLHDFHVSHWLPPEAQSLTSSRIANRCPPSEVLSCHDHVQRSILRGCAQSNNHSYRHHAQRN